MQNLKQIKIKEISRNLYTNHFKKSLFVIALIIATIIVLSIDKDGNIIYGEIKKSNIQKSVTITGTVIAREESGLSFEKSGRIENINVIEGATVKKGQILANINSKNEYATLISAEGSYENAKANYNDVKNGATEIEIKIKEESLSSAQNNLLQANQAAIDTARNIYSGIFDIFNNKLTSLFNYDGISYNLNKTSCNQALSATIEDKIQTLNNKLKSFDTNTRNIILSQNGDTDQIKADNQIINTLSDEATALTRDASLLIDDLNQLYSGACSTNDASLNETRSIISTSKKTMESIVSTLNTNKSQILSYRNSYNSALLSLEQVKNGATEQKIKSLQSLLKSAEGSYENAKANYDKNFIKAPYDGIITKININTGEISSINEVAINIITNDDYEISAKLTEIDLNKVKVNDKAQITFDAYGIDDIYLATIEYIDNASTKEGNNNYYYAKISLNDESKNILMANNRQIKSGMNAEIKVITESKNDVLIINNKYIMYKDGQYFVKAANKKENNNPKAEDFVEMPIKTGILGDSGEIEIIDGPNQDYTLYPIDEADIAKIKENSSSVISNSVKERSQKMQSTSK